VPLVAPVILIFPSLKPGIAGLKVRVRAVVSVNPGVPLAVKVSHVTVVVVVGADQVKLTGVLTFLSKVDTKR
jgi:hypothetical protein